MEILLRAGADAHARDSYGNSPFDHALAAQAASLSADQAPYHAHVIALLGGADGVPVTDD